MSKKIEKDTTATKTDTAKVPIEAATTAPTTPAKGSRKAGQLKAKVQAQVTETLKKLPEETSSSAQKESFSLTASPKATHKGKTAGKKVPTVPDVTPKKEVKAFASAATPSSKRQPPGKLDISAATKAPENDTPSTWSTKQDIQPKPIRTVSATASTSVPASPAATSTGSPIKKPIGAKTLRVVATPRTESPPHLPPITTLPQVPTVEKLRSRQASIASIYQPGTPASDLISDTASFTSTSISRANSPPLLGGKVGSAPIRKKTKSQAKKDRQERARQAEEERAMDELTPEPEVVQAPIVGRKKKAKKPASNPKPHTAQTKNQPETYKLSAKEEEELEELYQANMAAKRAAAVRASIPSPPVQPIADPEPPQDEKSKFTAQSILADLQKTGELVASALEFFKPPSSSLTHASKAASMSGGPVGPPDPKIHFTEADLEALAKKHPIRLSGQDGTSDCRTLITPQGKLFWGLTQELEEKALELEKRIEEFKGASRFHPKKHITQNAAGQSLPALATALKEASAKLSKSTSKDMLKLESPAYQGGPSQRLPLPSVHSNEDLSVQQPQTPADAGVYLNQFVLPNTDNPPPNAPRPEMAAVGGLPGAGTTHISNAKKLDKAAKAVATGGAVGPELEGIGAITADLLGGVFTQNLEALIGADLGFSTASIDTGFDVYGLTSALEGASNWKRRAGRSVLSLEEAEQVMLAAKKDHEALEKKLIALIKRNRKIVGTGGL